MSGDGVAAGYEWDPRRGMIRRLETLDKIGADPELRGLEYEVCRRDMVFWARRWVWTYDERRQPSLIPFLPFPIQEGLLRWLADRDRLQEGGLIEKSRDMGATYCCVVFAVHAWLFRPGGSTGFGSRKLDLVDSMNDPDSVLQKARVIIENLPRWMRPEGYKVGKHDGYCKILNPATKALIVGEGGDQIGRGGRNSRYFIDEAAFLDSPEKVDAAMSANTEVRIDVSTPNGPGNPFARKRFSKTVPVFRMHYSDDPRKDVAWRDKKKRELNNPVVWAKEFEIDYSASVEGVCIPALWVRAAVDLHLSERFRAKFPDWAPSGDVECGFDVADGGSNKNVVLGRSGMMVTGIERWNGTNTTATAWRARDAAVTMGAKLVHYDVSGIGTSIRGTWESAMLDENERKKLPFHPHAIRSGEVAGDVTWDDGLTSREKFVNIRSELAWILRRRFERAYEFVEEGIDHPSEEMISILNDEELIADLSLPRYYQTDVSKTMVESKKEMAKRGIASPDNFDACCYAFAVERGWAHNREFLERLAGS